ncbi:MAG: 1-acyl-sn-glycerol-3-phosphate acyltransferase [Desulfobacteraceae bacterium]|nr:MAG: 1-acyl-sn-glycerol-3-phosphate acyltransferase [Desulfobacteraceae bacterium]
MSSTDISAGAKAHLWFQYVVGRLMIAIAAPLVILAIKAARYRIRDIHAVRRRVRDLTADHPGPWLICANHLTLIDSVILAYAMFPAWKYVWEYRRLPWNVPEWMNFNRNPLVGLACFATKCIPVVRGGDRAAVRSTMGRCAYLLGRGESLMIFPEGTRSRNGRVNTAEFSYGAGRLFCGTPGCRVMCVYMRGDGQDTYSNFPRCNETFTVAVEECIPEVRSKGLRAHRDSASQIVNHLSEMERRYFASNSASSSK